MISHDGNNTRTWTLPLQSKPGLTAVITYASPAKCTGKTNLSKHSTTNQLKVTSSLLTMYLFFQSQFDIRQH
jgi:hypothetical protein